MDNKLTAYYVNDDTDDTFPIKVEDEASHVLVLGKTKSGKSKWIAKYMYENADFYDYVIVFSSVARDGWRLDDFDYKFASHVLENYTPEKLENIFEIQKKKGKNMPYIAIIFDDCDVDYNHDDYLNKTIVKARHYNISFIFSVQYFSMCSTQMRSQCDIVAITNIDGYSNKRQVFNYISQYFHEDISEFYKVLDVNKKNYDVIMFNKSKKANDDAIYIFHYDYRNIPRFEIGKFKYERDFKTVIKKKKGKRENVMDEDKS